MSLTKCVYIVCVFAFIAKENDDSSLLECTYIFFELFLKNKLTRLISWVKRPICNLTRVSYKPDSDKRYV